MRWWPLLAIWSLGGCDDPGASAAAPAPTATTSASASAAATLPLEVSWKQSPIALQSALAFSRGGAALHITFSTHALECQHLREAVQEHPDEVHFDVTVAPLLEPDGKEQWAISSARFGQITRRGNLGAIRISSYNPTEDVRASFDHRWPFPPSELTVKGDVVVKGCGVLPWSTKAKVRPQHALSASLAGKKLVINGATIEAGSDGTETLRLTSEPHPCGTVIGSDIAMTLTLAASGNRVSAARVEGYALARTLFKALDGAAITAQRAATPSVDEGSVDLAIAGEADVGGFRLSLDGTVSAERCAAGAGDTPAAP